MKQVYGMDIWPPDKRDVMLYKRHAQIGSNATMLLEVKDGQKIASKGTTM